MIQCVDLPSSEPVCLLATSITVTCVALKLATQLLLLSDFPPVHIIVIHSPSPITPSPARIHMVSKTQMTRLTVLQQSLLFGVLPILLVAQASPPGYAEESSMQSDQIPIPEHIPACQELVRLLSCITLTTRENLDTTSRLDLWAVTIHHSTFLVQL